MSNYSHILIQISWDNMAFEKQLLSDTGRRVIGLEYI